MKTRTTALFAFWMTLAAVLATLPAWAGQVAPATGSSSLLTPSNALLLAVGCALVAVQQLVTGRVAATVAGWFARLDARVAGA
jgi:hypothetical protein